MKMKKPATVTGSWLTLLALWWLYLSYGQPLPYAEYVNIRFALAVPLVAVAIGGVFFFGSKFVFEEDKSSQLRWITTSLLIFWALAPALWFFVEYFAVVHHRIIGTGPNGEDLKAYVKDFEGFSANVWAAFAVVNGLLVKAQIDHREKLLGALHSSPKG